jgi:nucleotide-binding universal stress UspA family protein
MGHDAPNSHGKIFDVSLAADLIMASGRPILIVPKLTWKAFNIEKAIIGWKSSREATRAVFDSVPLLKFTNEVDFLAVSSKSETNKIESIPQFDIVESLARHGLKIIAHSINDDRKPGLVIRDFAKEHQADLLIIGTYRCSRLREKLLGGVTEYILRHATLPVLLANLI